MCQPYLKYTLKCFHTCISRSRYFITTLLKGRFLFLSIMDENGQCKMAADEKSTLKLYFDCRFHTLHTRVPTQKLNEICVYVYQTALKYAVGTCMWIH